MEERLIGEVTTLETRRLANETVDKQKRYKQILEILGNKELTAKEIAQEMWMEGLIPSNERNFTAPRLTELSIMGIVEPIGKKKCMWTNKMVSVYKRRDENENGTI